MSDPYSKIPQPFTNIGCQDLLQETVSICGWVRKRHFANRLKLFRWPKVYMVISKGCLYYYKNEFCKSLAGKFSLFGYNSVTRASEINQSEALFAYKIDHIHNDEFKSYYFACSSETEMKQWMKVIKEELKIANDAEKRDGDYYYTQGFSSRKTEQTPEAQGLSADSGFGHSNDGDTTSISYHDIEESIYDSPDAFKAPEDYSAKRANEVSDDEDILNQPPPIPARLATQSSEKEKKKKKKKKKRIKEEEEASAVSKQPVSRSDSDAISKQPVSRSDSDAKAAATALASEMQGLFVKKKQPSTEDSPREKKSSRKEPSPPPEAEQVDDDDDEDEDKEEDGSRFWNSIHFDGEKEKASEIIRDIGENGVFLVRDGDGGGKVLVVFAQNMPKKYKINFKDDQYYIAITGPKADTLEDLLYEYFITDLPNTDVLLTTPFQMHERYS